MGRGTGLHADQTGRQRREELHHLTAAKLLPRDDLLGRVDAVDLEHVLGDIQTDRGNVHVDGSPDVILSNDHPTAIRRRERAPSTTSTPDIGGPTTSHRGEPASLPGNPPKLRPVLG
jgi:hypothetical protein